LTFHQICSLEVRSQFGAEMIARKDHRLFICLCIAYGSFHSLKAGCMDFIIQMTGCHLSIVTTLEVQSNSKFN